MPRAPIQTREIYAERLPDGSLRPLEFALVGTSLGAMVEPRPVMTLGNFSAAEDPADESFDRMVIGRREDVIGDILYVTGGFNTPLKY